MSGDFTKLQRAMENGQHLGSPVQVFCIEMNNAMTKGILTVSSWPIAAPFHIERHMLPVSINCISSPDNHYISQVARK